MALIQRANDDDRTRRARELARSARELPDAERAAFLAAQCGDDAQLLALATIELRRDEASDPIWKLSGIVSNAIARAEPRSIGGFVIVRELGAGAMGSVYLARQGDPSREVALKVLHPHLGRDERTRQRFKAEAQKLSRLHHSGIVEVLAVGGEAGLHYFAMEYVPGHDLGEELRRLRRDADATGEPLLPARAEPGYFAAVADRIAQVCDALQHAHDAGLVHRDVKPQNLLFAADGRVKITDLGIARDASAATVTQTGDMLGTPYYMSPEQARGGRTDSRTDVYSLGVVLYEFLTLRRPFDGVTSQEVMRDIGIGDAPTPHAIDQRIPRDLESICCKAMEYAPRRRYARAADFAADLRRFLAHEAVDASPVGARVRAGRFARRHRKPLLAAALLVVGAGLGFGVVSAASGPSRREALLERIDERLRVAAETDEVLRGDHDLSMMITAALNDGDLRADDAGVAEFRQRYEETSRELLGSVRTCIDAARAVRANDLAHAHTSWDADLEEAKRLRERLREYAGGVPEDLDANPTFPRNTPIRIRVDGGAKSGVTIVSVPLDGNTGRSSEPHVLKVALGADGAYEARVPVGPVRFVVVQDGVGFAELVRWVEPSSTALELVAHVVREDVRHTGMVQVAGGKCAVVHMVRRVAGEKRESLSVEFDVVPFWLDARPVSNADFERFLRATGRPRPDWWPDSSETKWSELPVVRVKWDDARDYAEWCGKRLPSSAEWLLAVRGPTAVRFPPGVTKEHLSDGTIRVGVALPSAQSSADVNEHEAGWRWCLAHHAPVGSFQNHAFTPGILDTLGSIAEWTETWRFDRGANGFAPEPNMRYPRGVACNSDQASAIADGLNSPLWVPINQEQIDTGFRCASSATPPQ